MFVFYGFNRYFSFLLVLYFIYLISFLFFFFLVFLYLFYYFLRIICVLKCTLWNETYVVSKKKFLDSSSNFCSYLVKYSKTIAFESNIVRKSKNAISFFDYTKNDWFKTKHLVASKYSFSIRLIHIYKTQNT